MEIIRVLKLREIKYKAYIGEMKNADKFQYGTPETAI
jgi:hypothetical protein